MVRAHLSEKNQGQFQRGMLKEFVENALLREIFYGRRTQAENTHTHFQNNRDKMAEKRKRKEEEYNDERGRLINYVLDNFGSISSLTKKQMDLAIIHAASCKARSLDNQYKELIAHGIIVGNRGRYTILEAEEIEAEVSPNFDRPTAAA